MSNGTEPRWTPADIADAQRALDEQPLFSLFWESQSGQDAMACIAECTLVANTTEEERCEIHREAMRAAFAGDDE